MNISQLHHERSSIALQRCKSFTFDVNQQAQSLVQWQQHYNQHSHGAFNGYLDELKLGGIHFFEEFTNQTLRQQCCINDNNVWLGFSLQPQRPKINNNDIASGQLMIRPSEVEFELITPQDFHIFGLVLDKSAIANEMAGLDTELWLNQADKMMVSEVNHYVSYELAKLIQMLLKGSNNKPDQQALLDANNPARLKRLKPLIASKLADLLVQTEAGLKQLQVLRPSKQRVLNAVSRYIEQTGQYPLTISELCHIAHVSRRALHYCFEQELGVSPIQYIRDCRLNEIRRILLQATNEITIADLAIDFGFFHISTFNSHYKQLFGETPSQTLQRTDIYQTPPMRIG